MDMALICQYFEVHINNSILVIQMYHGYVKKQDKNFWVKYHYAQSDLGWLFPDNVSCCILSNTAENCNLVLI